MHHTGNILIKDPYLNTSLKTETRPHSTSHNFSHPSPFQPVIKEKLKQTQNDFKRLNRAYTDQEKLTKKILDYQTVNNQYHQAMKVKNLDLNNKVQALTMEKKIVNQKFQQDYLKSYNERDMLVRKYEDQAEEVLYLKKNINNLIDCKTKLEDQINRMTFLLEKEADRYNIQMRQTIMRMENMEVTLKKVIQTKDSEISQLRHRLKGYQDENKRLNQFNRTLQLTSKQQQKGIDNLSQIHQLQSNNKEQRTYEKENKHQNQQHYDPKTLYKQLEQQKNANGKLQQQINQLKKRKLFQNDDHLQDLQKHQIVQRKQQNPNENIFNISKCEGLVGSITTLRNGINKQVFDVFFKSVRDGEKHRSNSLVIFIQNWKTIEIDRIQPYIISYFEARNNLKEMALDKQSKKGALYKQIQEVLPLHIGSRKGRNEINTWILSTIQFTKNQRQVAKKTLNNLLLFLFRLLTIQYRITYPMQGKSFVIDNDVRNELLHETTKAINYIIQYK